MKEVAYKYFKIISVWTFVPSWFNHQSYFPVPKFYAD